MKDVDGIVWFRTVFELAKKQIKKDLTVHLGTIDDIDKVWINGTEIGSTVGWDILRNYKIPSELLEKGKNQIAIRVIDHSNEGGFRCEPEAMNIYDQDVIMTPLATTWRYKVAYDGPVAKPDVSIHGLNKRHATVLFNGMINPITNFTIAGFIWYQGEAEQMQSDRYRTLFPALIAEWRKQWNNPNLPFYYVQLAPYKYTETGQSYALREAQQMSLAVPNTGMAVILDIENEDNIHPKNKHDVGDRLARWALAKTYDRDIVYSGPKFSQMKIEGYKIRLFFDHAANGLRISEVIERQFSDSWC